VASSKFRFLRSRAAQKEGDIGHVDGLADLGEGAIPLVTGQIVPGALAMKASKHPIEDVGGGDPALGDHDELQGCQRSHGKTIFIPADGRPY
jgi:hypothetical protein